MTQNEINAAEERADYLGKFDDIPFEPINLDCWSADPVDYAALERTLDKLSLYCEAKRNAMKLRLAGDIDGAQQYERRMEQTYARLPEWAQW